ncbi:GNAT family N-acetyltransferase [Lacicoccus alkaliphilus]|uniref:Diamine N-acetyltransferase n=1 Tax=Lacicoccus alkaliphilus DSM 16010 TaxID=1123231 RepID=A0A1M7HF48_9BACL|nr:GNAT family N-acetyltransferase [Salinicoccus alkaliphilus]SHM27161.1 diamine N-acetyltransferase [Salinicoccus alkaliphilus DSM 16010]
MIVLKEITEDNFHEVIRLKVGEAQAKFVAPNVKSLAECWLYRDNGDVFPYAVYDKEEMVGFLLLDLDEEKREYMIWRMMVDEKFQGRGYGRQIVEHVIERAKGDAGYDSLIADYVMGNEAMKKLLGTLGFEETGFEEDVDEVVMTLDVQN